MQENEEKKINVIEEYELPVESSQEDLALAETILVNLLVQKWLTQNAKQSTKNKKGVLHIAE